MARVGPHIEGEANSTDWLRRVEGIRQWKRGQQRAPHKPLLLLHAIAQLRNDCISRLPYAEVGPKLSGWLNEFGLPNRNQKPEQPFWRLQHDDGLWSVDFSATVQSDVASEEALRKSPELSNKALCDAEAVGSLTPDFADALLDDPVLMLDIVQFLLRANWPESLHSSICRSVRLDLEGIETSLARGRTREVAVPERRRDPEFRTKVLRAYDFQCAMCRFDGRLGGTTIGLEAAHVQWWAENGPDETSNGLSLCAMHHQLFDRGVLGLSSSRKVMVSEEFVGRGSAAKAAVTSLAGQELLAPRHGKDDIVESHRVWHEEQVFRGPAR